MTDSRARMDFETGSLQSKFCRSHSPKSRLVMTITRNAHKACRKRSWLPDGAKGR